MNGSLHSLEHKILRLLKAEGKVAQGWSELLLVTDGTAGYDDTVINAWKGGDPGKNPGVADITSKGYRCVNSNSTAYYLGWEGIKNPDAGKPGQPATLGIGVDQMYIDIAAGVPAGQRQLLLGAPR